MSTYSKLTKNPKTGEFEYATWMDDYFGRHHYGVKFPDGEVIDPEKVELETMDMPNNTKKEICCELCRPNTLEKKNGLDTCRNNMCGCHFPIDKNKEEVDVSRVTPIRVNGRETFLITEAPDCVAYAPSPQSPLSEEKCPCGGKRVEGKCSRPVVNLDAPSSNEDWEKNFTSEFGLELQNLQTRREVVEFIRTTRLEAQRSLAEEILDLQREEPLMVEGGVALDKIISVDNLKIVLSSRGLLPKITE